MIDLEAETLCRRPMMKIFNFLKGMSVERRKITKKQSLRDVNDQFALKLFILCEVIQNQAGVAAIVTQLNGMISGHILPGWNIQVISYPGRTDKYSRLVNRFVNHGSLVGP